MHRSVFVADLFPFVLRFTALVSLALVTDYLLHVAQLVWIGRWLGIPAVALLGLSFLYSLRKRKRIELGTLKGLLMLHERLAWAGSWLALVHAGVHFHALIPWLVTAVMLVSVVSGMVGQHLLKSASGRLKGRRARLAEQGIDPREIEERLWAEDLLVDAMRRWRVVHMPITLGFALLLATHVGSIVWWGW